MDIDDEIDEEELAILVEKHWENKRRKLEENKVDADEESDDDDFVNPLAIKTGERKLKEDSDKEGFESDASIADDLDIKNSKKDKSKIESKKAFEEVPKDAGYDSMDSDEIAETWAIAKIMLRKKQREELIDKSYNRYSFFDDENNLPDWFVDDEKVAHV